MKNRRVKAGRRLVDITERLGDEIDFPKATFRATAHIEMSGNCEAIVDGCRGVLEYGENVIRLNTGKLVVRFTGSCLTIKTLQMNQAIVVGNILSVDFTS